jgi:nucleolar GTP-binding protein
VPTPFEPIPEPPAADELVDRAFSRAARTGGSKEGTEAQSEMLRVAATVTSDNLEHVERSWPDFDAIDPFYRDLADAVADVDDLRDALGRVGGAARTIDDLHGRYRSRVAGDTETARKHRKQAFARIADVVESVAEPLDRLRDARGTLGRLPEIRPDEPAIAVTGTPNVGKTAFVNHVTAADNETASYPFTTEGIAVGHLERDRVRYQLVDTPGLLDRDEAERNDVEATATAVLDHAADAVLVLVDPTGTSGYPLDTQLALRERLAERDDLPLVTARSKADLPADAADDGLAALDDLDPIRLSVPDDETAAALDAVIAAAEPASTSGGVPPNTR